MRARAPAGARVVLAGRAPAADVPGRAGPARRRGARRVRAPRRRRARSPVQLGLVGEHHVANALSAAAAALEVLDLETVAERLATARPASRWRMEVDRAARRRDGRQRRVQRQPRLDARRAAHARRHERRQDPAHRGGARAHGRARRRPPATPTWTSAASSCGSTSASSSSSGPTAGGIHAGAVLEGSWGSESLHVDDVDAAVALLRGELAPGDVVLVKGSRSAGLERVADALLAPAPAPEGPAA